MTVIVVILNQDGSRALIVEKYSNNKNNFPNTKVQQNENPNDAAYRCINELFNIKNHPNELHFVRREKSTLYNYSNRDVYVVTTVLPEKHVNTTFNDKPIFWIPIEWTDAFVHAYGNGSCLLYLMESIKKLKEDHVL